jgi:hypothetical protein
MLIVSAMLIFVSIEIFLDLFDRTPFRISVIAIIPYYETLLPCLSLIISLNI